MKSILLAAIAVLTATISFSQNVGIGTSTPSAPLHIRSATNFNPVIIDGVAPTYSSILENGAYRGYWGSFSGDPEDVDFGTGSGTTGKLHLTIQATPRLTINNLGNVGIGTTNPNYKMHVNGGDMFVQSSSGYFKFGYDGGDQWRYASTGGGAHLMMQSSTDGATFTPRHYFDQNGRVGFGTGAIAPAAALEVSTTSSETIRMKGSNPYMSFYDNTNGYQGYLWYNGADIVLGSSTAPIRFASNGYRMAINTDGRVTIGSGNTAAAGYMLSVDGKVICEEARVQISSAWPDYVFHDDYKLRPIEELEKLIKAEKHLPDMPSAAVVEKEGIALGDMNKKLLEKVEELTLYIIELNKKNTKLTEEMESVKNSLKALNNK